MTDLSKRWSDLRGIGRALTRRSWPAPTVGPAVETPYFGNFFCLIPKTDLAFVAISKNAVTFLKKVAVVHQTGVWLPGFFGVHAAVGYTDASPYLVKVEDMPAYEARHGARRKFAVWRSPVGRMESTYRLFCAQGTHRENFLMAGLQFEPSAARFISYAQREWAKPDPLWQDEHLRRQVDYFGPDQVDDVVSLPALHDYLSDHGARFVKELSNATSSAPVYDDRQVELIQEHYRADYEIEVTVR